MAMKTINYNVNLDGITPSVEQFAGTQGDHRVTKLSFTLSDELYNSITDTITTGKAVYRFDVYDGEGGIWQSNEQSLKKTVSIELEERHTRFGGKITVYLVITVLNDNNKTKVESYSFPAKLKLQNRPEGIYQDGENVESVSSLCEAAKAAASKAETLKSQVSVLVSEAENSVKTVKNFSAEIEQKLKNGEYDGVGVQKTEVVNGQLLVTYTDGTVQNAGDVKGDKGEKGDIGPTGADGKDAVVEQHYSATSENAQSGKAVYEAINGTVPRKSISAMDVDEPLVLCIEKDTIPNEDGMPPDDSFVYKLLDTGSVGGKEEMGANTIATRDSNGNLWTGIPIDDVDCVNKKYVDEKTLADQTYNAESKNAQSGKAVAAALANLKEDKVVSGIGALSINEGDKTVFDACLTSDAPEHTPVRIYNKNYVGENDLIGQTFDVERDELFTTVSLVNIDSAGAEANENSLTLGNEFIFKGEIFTPTEYANYVRSELKIYIEGYDEYRVPLHNLEVGSTYVFYYITNVNNLTIDPSSPIYKHTIEKIIVFNETKAGVEEVKADGTINADSIQPYSVVSFKDDLNNPTWSNTYTLNLTYSTTDFALKKYVNEKTLAEQSYNAESENAQSGKAVAEALQGCVSKVEGNGHTYQAYCVDALGQTSTLEIEDNTYFEYGISDGKIPSRQSNGNLFTNSPVNDLDCVNKAYVDGLVGDIETLLGGI